MESEQANNPRFLRNTRKNIKTSKQPKSMFSIKLTFSGAKQKVIAERKRTNFPVDGVEEAEEVVVSRAHGWAELGGEFSDEIGHLVEVFIHGGFENLHCWRWRFQMSDPKIV